MNATRGTFSRRRRAGLTLLEVVAGLALLSTVLVAVLTAKARATRQAAEAQRRLDAVAAADRLLAGWWQDVLTLPKQGEGHVPGNAGFAWRTRPVPSRVLDGLSASVIRLEVLDIGPGARQGRAVLASVEVVLDDAPPPGSPASPPPSNGSSGRQLARVDGGRAP